MGTGAAYRPLFWTPPGEKQRVAHGHAICGATPGGSVVQLHGGELWVLRPDGGVELSNAPEVEAPPPAWVPQVLRALDETTGDEVRVEHRGISLVAWRLRRTRAGAETGTLVLVRPQPAWMALGALTQRQRDVCEYAASGATVGEIAAHLGISLHTVRSHLKAAYATLGVSNRVELVNALSRQPSTAPGL